MLDKAAKDKLKTIIESKLKIAEDDIIELEELCKPISPENAIGRISRMDAINNKSVNEASLRQTKEKMIRLKVALTAIDKPSYGICLSCERQIEYGRLLLLPESTKCKNCTQ